MYVCAMVVHPCLFCLSLSSGKKKGQEREERPLPCPFVLVVYLFAPPPSLCLFCPVRHLILNRCEMVKNLSTACVLFVEEGDEKGQDEAKVTFVFMCSCLSGLENKRKNKLSLRRDPIPTLNCFPISLKSRLRV